MPVFFTVSPCVCKRASPFATQEYVCEHTHSGCPWGLPCRLCFPHSLQRSTDGRQLRPRARRVHWDREGNTSAPFPWSACNWKWGRGGRHHREPVLPACSPGAESTRVIAVGARSQVAIGVWHWEQGRRGSSPPSEKRCPAGTASPAGTAGTGSAGR